MYFFKIDDNRVIGDFYQGDFIEDELTIKTDQVTFLDAMHASYNYKVILNDNGTLSFQNKYSEEQLQAQSELIAKQEAQKARDEAMMQGFEYNGVQISVTKDDGDGMVQVKVSFELGLTSTVIHFANGSKLPMSAEEFPAFALQFVTERGKFFS